MSAAPAPHHYAKACGPLVVSNVEVPDPAKSRQYRLTCRMTLPDSGEAHVVHCHYYTVTPPAVNEMVEFRGSVAHDGSMAAPLELFVNKVEQFPWAEINDEHYLDNVPYEKRLHVTLQGALETDVVDRMFTIAGLIYGNGRNNTFRFKVWIPDNPRWANLPFPARGQVIMVDGEINRRDPRGLFIIDLTDISLPTGGKRSASVAAPATPSPKRKPTTRSKPTVTTVEGEVFHSPGSVLPPL